MLMRHDWNARDRLLVGGAQWVMIVSSMHESKPPTGVPTEMSTLHQLENQVALLLPAEKAQLLQVIARELGEAFPGVESTPGVCGGEPCIVRTRIPVWVLEQARRLGVSEADLLRSYATLRAEDLVNAWSYVRVHRDEIERQIRENEEA